MKCFEFFQYGQSFWDCQNHRGRVSSPRWGDNHNRPHFMYRSGDRSPKTIKFTKNCGGNNRSFWWKCHDHQVMFWQNETPDRENSRVFLLVYLQILKEFSKFFFTDKHKMEHHTFAFATLRKTNRYQKNFSWYLIFSAKLKQKRI